MRSLQLQTLKNIEIIVAGENDYIEGVNMYLQKEVEKEKGERKIRILNCYNVENVNIKEILNKHDKILNTAGEKSKEKFLSEIN